MTISFTEEFYQELKDRVDYGERSHVVENAVRREWGMDERE